MSLAKSSVLADYKSVLGILLVLVVGAIVVFNNHSFTGLQVADVTPPVIFSLVHTPPTTPLVGYPVRFIAEAKDNVGVSSVEIYVDGQKAKTCSNKPPSPCTYWTTYWNVSKHTYYAKAYDAAGNSVRSPVSGSNTFQVQPYNSVPKGTDISRPSVSVTVKTLQNAADIPVNISATASDNVKVKSIEIYVDDGLVLTCQATPCVFLKLYPNIGRAQYYYAKAYDTNGNIGIDPPSGQKWFRVTGNNQPPQNNTTITASVAAYSSGQWTDLQNNNKYLVSGFSFIVTASSNVGVSFANVYFKNITDGKTWTKACDFTQQYPLNANCNLSIGWAIPGNGTHEYWGEAWNKQGGYARDPPTGAKTMDCNSYILGQPNSLRCTLQ